MREPPDDDLEPDILLAILLRVRQTVGLSDDQAAQIEQDVRAAYGGMRFRVAKRKRHPTAEERRKIFANAMADSGPDQEVAQRNGIGRATLYRYIKRGA